MKHQHACRQQDIQNSKADLAVVMAKTGQREKLARIEADNIAARKEVRKPEIPQLCTHQRFACLEILCLLSDIWTDVDLLTLQVLYWILPSLLLLVFNQISLCILHIFDCPLIWEGQSSPFQLDLHRGVGGVGNRVEQAADDAANRAFACHHPGSENCGGGSHCSTGATSFNAYAMLFGTY